MLIYKERLNINQSLEENVQLIQQWLGQFDFIQRDQVEIHVSISKGKVIGKLMIRDITHFQQQVLQYHARTLPGQIRLILIPKVFYLVDSDSIQQGNISAADG